MKKDLLRVAGELRQTKTTHKSLEEHAQALELACSLNFTEGKAARLERDKLRVTQKTNNLRQKKMIDKERGMLSVEREKADRLQVEMKEHKAISTRREGNVEKFRLQAARSEDRRRKQFEKDYSKVRAHSPCAPFFLLLYYVPMC